MANKPPAPVQDIRKSLEGEALQTSGNNISMAALKAQVDRLEEYVDLGAKNVLPPDAKVSIAKSTEKTAGYDEKQRDIKSAVRNPLEDWRDWLEAIAKKAGVADPAMHAKWVEANFRREDILLSKNELEQMERDWPLSGEAVELQQKAAIASKASLAKNADRWRRFAQTTLAATLRRMEERGDTPEEEMDVLVSALRPVREHLRPTVGTLMLAARARMAQQTRQLDGYYKTRGALADTLARLKDEPSRRLRCYLYWEILRELQGMDAEQISAGTWASIVNTDANNLASTLDDLQLIGPSVNCMKLAVAAGSAARMLGEDKQASKDAHIGLVKFFHEEAPVTPEWAALLDDMGNVPATWRHAGASGPSDLDMWLVELGAAIARAGLENLEDSPRKVASALFNAGVTVSRGAKSGKGEGWRNPRECRIVLNGAGLLWVLSQRAGDTPADFRQALMEHRGGSCTANLLGVVVELDLGAKATESLTRFINVLHGLKDGFSSGDFSRIEAVARKFNLKPLADTADPVRALTDLLEQCLLPHPDWKSAWDAFAKQPRTESLGALLAKIGRLGNDGFAKALTPLAEQLDGFEKQARSWPNAFIDTSLEALLPEWHAGIEAEWRGMLADPNLPELLASMANELIHG